MPPLPGAQSVGALISNALWGWWGDNYGKAGLLKVILFGRLIPPTVILLLALNRYFDDDQWFYVFVGIFFIFGALASNLTVAVIGFLMEISSDSMRFAYSGYFNANMVPAFLLPLLAEIVATVFGLTFVFAISMTDNWQISREAIFSMSLVSAVK